MAHDPAPARRAGDAGTPVVMVHGFTQTHRCLGPLADALAAGGPVVLPDAPGHGPDPRGDHLDCPGAADALAATAGGGHWLGYSMGGRMALHVALAHPALVRSLVLVGATPGIEDPRRRAERRDHDGRLADRLESIGVAAFCREWLAAPMFAGLPPWARFEAERASNRVEGLAGSLRHAGTGSMAPVWDRLHLLEMPVLCMAGGADERFAATAQEMADAIGDNASVALVPGAGHAAHLERPREATALVRAFLDRAGR